MANIEIDGVTLEAEPGTMIIEVADAAGIKIPRFCYHKKLSVAASCRMCLVDVANIPKPVPACATPVSDGMTVNTHSARALDAQKSVMEFLLINHPLDCPICDQGGECELQDLSITYGTDISRFSESKRIVESKNIGPLIKTDMTRCIHCTRCVRFGKEIAGIREMGETGRGEHMEIGTYIAKTIDSEISANVIDLCPVGALTAKPSLFKARAWELESSVSIAAHDCLGSNIDIHSRRGEVIRVVPDDNDSINESWISDRDRFSCEALNTENRLTEPMIKQDGKWIQTDWQTALNVVVDGLKKVKAAHGADSLAAIASPSSTTEELFLLQKLMRDLGTSNIETRLGRVDFTNDNNDPTYPSLGMDIADIEHLEATLLVGSNIHKEQPIAGIQLRKSTRDGSVMAINPTKMSYNFRTNPQVVTTAAEMIAELTAVAKALISMEGVEAVAGINELKAEVNDSHKTIAENLKNADKAAILFGQYACNHADFSKLAAIANAIAVMSGASFGTFTDGANSAGAHLAGAVPHRGVGAGAVKAGMNINEMLNGDIKAFILHGVEPELDCKSSGNARKAMDAADLVIAMTAFKDGAVSEYADVMLPTAAFSETSGTFVNVAGTWQTFKAAVSAKGEARPAWKILRVLANLLELPRYDYVSSEEVLTELQVILDSAENRQGNWELPTSTAGTDSPANVSSIYQVDALVRRAVALQETLDGRVSSQEGSQAGARKDNMEAIS